MTPKPPSKDCMIITCWVAKPCNPWPSINLPHPAHFKHQLWLQKQAALCNNSQRSIESNCFGKHSQYFNRDEPLLCRAVKAIFHELAWSLPIHQFCRSMHTLSFEVSVEPLPSRTLFCPHFNPVTKELIGFDLLEKRRLNKWLLLLLRISHQD